MFMSCARLCTIFSASQETLYAHNPTSKLDQFSTYSYLIVPRLSVQYTIDLFAQCFAGLPAMLLIGLTWPCLIYTPWDISWLVSTGYLLSVYLVTRWSVAYENSTEYADIVRDHIFHVIPCINNINNSINDIPCISVYWTTPPPLPPLFIIFMSGFRHWKLPKHYSQ